jgi:hypothetical protein
MANALVTSTLITNEVLRVAHNNSAFLGNVNTDYDEMWSKRDYKPGATISVRKPPMFQIRSGATAVIQDVTEPTVPVTLQPEIGVDFAVSDFDLSTAVGNDGNLEADFKRRFIDPAGKRIAGYIDAFIGSTAYKAISNFSGTPGTTPSTASSILNALIKPQNFAMPKNDTPTAAINPATNAALVDGLKGLFNDQATLARQLKTGMMATNLGVDFTMSQNVPTHTVGALGGTPLSNGATQGTTNSGSTDNPYVSTTSVVTDGWSNSVTGLLKAGDVITFAGVYAVNPETKASTGVLRDFVVTADANSDGSGNATIVVSPGVIAGGAFQNVTNRIADNSAITVKTGTAATAYAQNLIWHRDAITFVTVDMDLPNGMDMVSRARYDGLSIRFVRGYDITNNRRISRFDVVAGAAVTYPDWAVRLTA